ncbi:MAG TPA: sulfatase-like hydrolase/transferase [Terriglobales bacterium]|nr:sulfatase-like hydrolase/transferase [Terriglobales bacterium]
MKLWFNTLLRLVSGTYFVLTSVYCLLAYLPYTYFFLVKAPPYAWMPWFVHHQAGLYWIAAAAGVAANWPVFDSGTRKNRRFFVGAGLLVAAGLYLSLRPFLPTLDDNRAAYAWSLIALLPWIAISLWKPAQKSAPDKSARERSLADDRPFAYSIGLLVALVVSIIYFAGARVQFYFDSGSLAFHKADAELTLWTLLSHVVLATLILSLINLIFLLAAHASRPQAVRRLAIAASIGIALWIALYRFLDGALSFRGWQAHLYAASLALALTLWGFSLVAPFLEGPKTASSFPLLAWIALAASAALAVSFPYMIGEADWSGFFQSIITIIVWIAVSLSLFRLRPARARYSAIAVIAVLAASMLAYKSLEASEILWSHPLGATDDEISLALEAYGGHDPSFQLAHRILGSGRSEDCGDLCRMLREYTNIRDTRARVDVKLVDQLIPSPEPRPNIFIFVIDSMRPDYLGAYNPRASYTPNLDALARDSVVFHHAFTQYAGTSLSEPAIWCGSMMLHAHYVQPFSRLNSLDRLLHVDNYRTVVSMDEILSVILPPGEVDDKLDTDNKLWNEFELGATLQQAEAALDSHPDPSRPVFFYAQPKNVHQFARNNVPSPTSQHWQSPAGLNGRITYEVHWVDSRLGEFFAYLKQRGLYDNSVIVVTSDHGDATGEFGRTSHSTSIWPEIMHVPLIVHLPQKMREHLVYDDARISTLTDITPTLYYLLGERPIRQNPLYGRPLFAETREELDRYRPKDLLLASDVRAVFGILTANGRYLYTTYDSPPQSYLFDLQNDPNAVRNVITPALKQRYDEEIIEHLQSVGDFYGYKPGVGSLLTTASR